MNTGLKIVIVGFIFSAICLVGLNGSKKKADAAKAKSAIHGVTSKP